MTLRKLTARSVVLAAVMILAATLLATGAMAAGPGNGTTVKVGKASWTSAEPVAAVYVELLDELGYNVKDPTMFSSNPIAYLAISKGDIDFWPNGWFPLHNGQLPSNWDQTADLAGNVCKGCAIQGYLVDKESAAKYNIKTLADFRRPEVKKAFDANGDGKADLFGCPPGWGCHETINFHLDAYDLRGDINHVTADYSANFANVMAREQAGEPVLYYTWAPNDTILKLVPGEDVVWIGVPSVKLAPAQEGLPESSVIAHGVTGAVTDPLTMGFVANDIRIAANQEFLDDNPAAAALFEQVSLPLGWISEATARISSGEDSKSDIQAIANEWIKANQSKVNKWLDAARAAAK